MTSSTRFETARHVADAVLFEGYLLYPYRATSAKNQVRWQFGVVGPVGSQEAGAGEGSTMFTETVLRADNDHVRIDLVLRFLQVQWRGVERCVDPAGDRFEPATELDVGTARWIPWHEAVEREVAVTGVTLDQLESGHTVAVDIPGGEDVEPLADAAGHLVGRLVRSRYALQGRLHVEASRPHATDDRSVWVVRARFENVAAWQAVDHPGVAPRDAAARTSFVGAHLLLGVDGGCFASAVDPPEWAASLVKACTNDRCWPILVGKEGEQCADIVLGSPIILPEHPTVADESPGDLYDATEIDEILTLRIMTMTDDEKLSARGTDPRAAAIIDRSDTMPPEIFERLHGALRGYDTGGPIAADFDDSEIPTFGTPPAWFSESADAAVTPETDSILVNNQRIAKGSRVRLRPRRRADAHDMFLAGQVAKVARIDRDVDGATHVAVLLEDDPATELHEWYGRFYYFGVEEIEPMPAADRSEVPS
jgi:hypothetical protein